MNHSISLAVVMLAVGVAIGWFSRGTMDESKRVALASEESAASLSKQMRSNSSPSATATKSAERLETKDKLSVAEQLSDFSESEEMNEHVAKVMESIAMRQKTHLEQHLSKIDQSVVLTDAQKKKVEEWLNQRTEMAKKYDVMEAANSDDYVVNPLSEDGLTSYLEEILDEDQKAEFDEFLEMEKTQKADSLALKNLSQLQKLIRFEDDQRDKVYQVLLDDATQRVGEKRPAQDMSDFMHQGIGVEMDPYDLGMESIMNDVVMADTPGDSKGMAEQLKTLFAERVDRKIDLLRPVLTEDQLNQYRADLSNKGRGFLDQMIMGLEMADQLSDEEGEFSLIKEIEEADSQK